MAHSIKPSNAPTHPGAAAHSDAQFIKSRIHFDPYAQARATNTRLPVVQIPATFWDGLQPQVQKLTPAATAALPAADVLVITWTTAETQALSAVFTGNHDFKTTWYPYKHNAATFLNETPAAIINESANADSLKLGIVGYYTAVTFNGKKVNLFKSEFHPADDGDKLPIIDLIVQAATETNPSLVITTGTAGAIGSYLEVGDAVITGKARFFLMSPMSYAAYPGITNGLELSSTASFKMDYVTKANSSATSLVKQDLTDIAQQKKYPGPTRNPAIFYNNVPNAVKYDAVSANGFSLDDKANTDGLQQLGVFNEMNDAFVAFALSQNAATKKLPWLSIRNMSEPQAPDLSKATKTEWENMYTAFGLYTTYNSAFACWAVICGLH